MTITGRAYESAGHFVAFLLPAQYFFILRLTARF